MERSKKRKLVRTKRKSLSPAILQELKMEALKFHPHLKPVINAISLDTLLYHLPEDKERFYRQLRNQ
jgi:hypothetical protein